MSQLNKMLVAQTGNGAMCGGLAVLVSLPPDSIPLLRALRTTHAKMVLDMVLKIFVRRSKRCS